MIPKELDISAEELRGFVTDVVNEHLTHFTGALIRSAEIGRPSVNHAHALAVAVRANVLLEPQSQMSVVRSALKEPATLEAVERAYPQLATRTETDWQYAVAEAWQSVGYKPQANRPQDMSILGHIELLEALRKGTAFFQTA
jgi:hypothetical protein